MTVLLFQFWFLLFLFSLWFPKLCWIKAMRVYMLILFLILEEMFSAFHIKYDVSYQFVMYSVYYIEECTLYEHFLESFYHKCVFNFVKIVPTSTEMTICFSQFVDAICHTDWVLDTEMYLHLWDKSYLIMVYDPFTVLLDSDFQYFFWGFLHLYSSVILANCFHFLWHFFFLLVLVFGQWQLLRMSLLAFLPLQFFGTVSEG